MLYIDDNGNIKVNRGDTFEVPLFVDVCSNILYPVRFPWKRGDTISIHVMEPYKPFELYLLGKEFTCDDLNENEDIIVRFDHEDTNFLIPGTYYYEAKLIRPWSPDQDPRGEATPEDERHDSYITIIPRRKFIIM